MNIVEQIGNYIKSYVAFEDESMVLPVSLWCIATHIFENFDAFPYMVITAAVKRSGKTRLSELMSFVSRTPQNFSAMTAATLFRIIQEKSPTIIFDEAEVLSSESASTLRAVLNVGYRKGQSIPRTVGQEVVEFKTYCPKIFILIGDVYDTLRDRSIVIGMKRGEPRKRFEYEATQKEGHELRDYAIHELQSTLPKIVERYREDRVPFLTDRDEEIWRPILALCRVLDPSRVRELQRIAVDLAAEKTAEKKRYVQALAGAENEAEIDDYAKRLLHDLYTVMGLHHSIYSAEAVELLKGIDLAPWRKFKGTGITVNTMADLLSRFGLRPLLIRHGKTVARGYHAKDVRAAIKHL